VIPVPALALDGSVRSGQAIGMSTIFRCAGVKLSMSFGMETEVPGYLSLGTLPED
jgi:hypothetical protein